MFLFTFRIRIFVFAIANKKNTKKKANNRKNQFLIVLQYIKKQKTTRELTNAKDTNKTKYDFVIYIVNENNVLLYDLDSRKGSTTPA